MKRKIRNQVFMILMIFLVLVINYSTFFITFSEHTSTLNAPNSGINGSTIVINDLEADYNYYMGLNYTSNNGSIPTTENKNIYNETNMVDAKITYYGYDINNINHGYVSLTELQDTFIYYKVLIVNNNGTTNKNDDYVEIELIDNPFTNRPYNKGFNGWTSTNQAIISFDKIYYKRNLKIPVTYTNDVPDALNIDLHANWIDAKVDYITNSHNWNAVFDNFDEYKMQPIGEKAPIYENVDAYERNSINWNSQYPNGAVNENGNPLTGRCNAFLSSCTYYIPTNNLVEGNTYYLLNNGIMAQYIPTVIGYTCENCLQANTVLSGYYDKVTLTNNQSLEGYYDEQGNKMTGTCRNSCEYYKLIQYKDNDNINLADGDKIYYYLATRDTNIAVINGNISTKWSSSNNKPFTFTGIYNGNNYTNNTWNVSNLAITCYNDTVIENLKISSRATNSSANPATSSTATRNFFGNYHNVKIGRGIIQDANYKTFNGAMGGNNSTANVGSSSNTTKYRFVVESGYYNTVTLTNGPNSNNSSKYLEAQAIYGSDYDRVTNNNAKLDVYYVASGTWGSGNYYSKSTDAAVFSTIVKSGSYGTGKVDHTTGIYVGGRAYGTHNAVREIKIEGGWTYNLIGGPLSDSSRGTKNDIYMYITGGSIDMITGGAGTSTTYGNRIISMTGGTVNYSIFGGSNAYNGDTSDGVLTGSSYIYIGGNAVVGNQDYIDSSRTLWGTESGSIFGNGNGNTSSSSIGSNENSTIVINGGTILANIYGGGNYSGIGISTSKRTASTQIELLSGVINGNIYGGGNKNGAGKSNTTATININLLNSEVKGSIFGGSREKGTIYGTVSETINGGVIENIYGGGEGNQTVVNGKITINVNDGIINNDIYGGSAFGKVAEDISITMNDGIVEGSIFGGAKGNNTYTPVVLEDIVININDGTINKIFGGNDASGIPEKNPQIIVNEGKINSIFGGGNQTGINNSSIIINDGTIETIYGGSNESGNVNRSSITMSGGEVTAIYGGNNLGGLTDTSNINISNGTVETIYGGGNQTGGNITNVILDGGEINEVYGGSNLTGHINATNVIVNNGTITSLYGGNNIGGDVSNSNVTINNGMVDVIYGGGNDAETVSSQVNILGGTLQLVYGGGNNSEGIVETTNLNMTSGVVIEAYGGGNAAYSTISNVILNGSTIENLYGGGKQAGLTTTNINIQNGVSTNVFGGSNTSGNIEDTNISINGGTIATLYGGNNIGGQVSLAKITMNDGNVTTIYGGGNNAATQNTKVLLNGGEATTLYGGGNDVLGTVASSYVNLINGIAQTVYGGGNMSFTDETEIIQNGANITNIYGGGNSAGVTETNVKLSSGNVTNVFGGSNQSGTVDNSYIKTIDSDITLNFNYNNVAVNPYWQNADYNTVSTITVELHNNTNNDINEYDIDLIIPSSELYSNYSSFSINKNGDNYHFDETNINYGINSIPAMGSITFEFSVYTTDGVNDFEINDYIIDSSSTLYPNVSNLYGGNNAGGLTKTTNIELTKGTYGVIYGGGNNANTETPNVSVNNIIAGNIYGGCNNALINNNTNILVVDSHVTDSIYGGGNLGIVGNNTNVYVTNSTIDHSVYAGGNGNTAIVNGSTQLLIDNNSTIGGSVFGGGNAAAVGNDVENNSVSNVYIAGARINGNVYGGANTSIVNGITNVNIGVNTFPNISAIKSDIIINGTVFGGGEANATGSENYDYSFISVTNGININLDAANYNNFKINGSIFGSGNASSTTGYSYINIKNYGSINDYKKNISIQRADLVVLNNSAIELSGATDRTNEYSTISYTLSRIKHLKLKNNSTLFLKTGANLVEELTSAIDIGGSEVLQTISISNNMVTKNVDNRIYLLEGKNLNIATNENATAYGKVNGMTFLGRYVSDRSGLANMGYYKPNLNDITENDYYLFTTGSYVLGLHKTQHDITHDGFYSNFVNENILSVDYVIPTPDDSTYYMWNIGEKVITMEITLTASKYLTLGINELSMLNYSDPNTVFSIVGFNYNDLNSGVELVDEIDVPRVASNATNADNVMSLVMKSGNSGLITKGTTSFLTTGEVIGTKTYKSENSSLVPNFQFYLYHSKNLATSGSMGSVTISFVISTPIDELNSRVDRVNLVVNLNRALYNTNDYEASMTVGKEYDLFASTDVNIASNGSLSAYYSLFVEGENIYRQGYHRTLVSTYVFPVNTKITLLNLNKRNTNEYYYYVVSESDYDNYMTEYNLYGEVSYDFSKFIRMGSIDSNNNYSDSTNNIDYYQNGSSFEEFIVIVDFADSNINEDVLNKSLLIELRNDNNNTVVSVLGIEQSQMIYNLYNDTQAVVEIRGNVSNPNIYPGSSINLNVLTNFVQEKIDSLVVYDTSYFDQQLGMKISFLDEHGNVVTGASLLGFTYEYDGITYYPRPDGSVRIRLANKMGNMESKVVINTTSSVAPGNYKMLIESFGSPDGIYYGLYSSASQTIDIKIMDTIYGLSMNIEESAITIDKTTGYNANGNNILRFNVKYNSVLQNPKLVITMERRNYDNIYSLEYDTVDLLDYITDDLQVFKENEYMLEETPVRDLNYMLNLKNNLISGTYRLKIKLYDGRVYIGDVYKYIVIKEAYHE